MKQGDRLWRWVLAAAAVVAAAAALGAPARGAWFSRTVADEPQYLLTAVSLWEDGDLDISDELADQRWRDFHEADLPEQTAPRADGSRLSPHDPGLPLLLAVPVGLGGWWGARLALAVLAGVLAGLVVWTAVRRFGVTPRRAALVGGAFGVVPPLVVYGTQVYPELPAAVLVVVVVAAATGRGRRAAVTGAVALLALPWLSVKYVPVVVALAVWWGWSLVRDRRWRTVAALGAFAAVGVAANLVFHRWVYGGWTVYAAGDHFAGGELTVMGSSPDPLSRAQRLAGLLTDRDFGLVRWAPVYLLAVPALGSLLRRRPPGWVGLVLPLAAAWSNATFVALTMHGWWWPGRQVVVVLPLVVLAVTWWVDRARPEAAVRRLAAVLALAAVGLWTWWWLLAEVLSDRRRLVTDFLATTEPLGAVWRVVLPDARRWDPIDVVLWWVWALALLGWGIWSWHRAAPAPSAAVDQEDPT